MKWRPEDDIDRPTTIWDEVLVEMKWLREDYKCDTKRKRTFLLNVARPCVYEARQRLLRIYRGYEEGNSERLLSGEPVIPARARDEYFRQGLLQQDNAPEPSSEGEETSHSFESLSTNSKRQAETPAIAFSSKRLRKMS